MSIQLLRCIAERTDSSAGQEALLGLPHMHQFLARNKRLGDSAWAKLWGSGRKTSAELAKSLVSRELTQEQVFLVLKTEKRVSVLEAFLTHNSLSDEAALFLIRNTKFDSPRAKVWLDSGRVPASVSWVVSEKAGGPYVGAYLLKHPEISDYEVFRIMGNSVQGFGPSAHYLFDSRPELAKIAVSDSSSSTSLISVACESRHMNDDLFHKALKFVDTNGRWGPSGIVRAIFRNPNASRGVLEYASSLLLSIYPQVGRDFLEEGRRPDFMYGVEVPWEEVTSDKDRGLIIRLASATKAREDFVRSLPWVTRELKESSPGAVACRKHQGKNVSAKTPTSADVLAETVVNPFPSTKATLVEVAEYLTSNLDTKTPEAWLVAVTLLEGGFEGTLRELLTAAESL